MSQWVNVVIERRKPLRRLVNAMDDLRGSTVGSGVDLVLSLERDIEKGAEVYVVRSRGMLLNKHDYFFMPEVRVSKV